MPRLEPERLLDDLDPEQREAVVATSGPVAILAGAGTGKTRVISRRTAYAIATEVVSPDQVLVVTFTDKAAGEMVERLRSLGLPGVTARTFHAHALSQLRFFWPSRHDGQPLPQLLDSKIPILGRLARQLPGHFRFTPAKDLADEVEWAKSRRIGARDYEREVARVAPGREPPIPIDLFVRTFENYERAKARQGRIDFDDLLVETVRPARGRRRRRRDRPRPQALVQRRRVPGHEPAPAAAARAVAGRPAGRVRRGRRRPDDLHVHRRLVGLPDDVRGPPPRRPAPRPDAELPLDAAGPRAGQPADRGRRPVEAVVDEPRGRAAADDHEVRQRLGRGGRDGRRDPRPHRGAASRRPRSPCSSG